MFAVCIRTTEPLYSRCFCAETLGRWEKLMRRVLCESGPSRVCLYFSSVSTRRTSEPRDTSDRQMSVNSEHLSVVVVVGAAVALTSLREFRTTQAEVLMDHREQTMDLCSEAGRLILLISFINNASAPFSCLTSTSTQIEPLTFIWNLQPTNLHFKSFHYQHFASYHKRFIVMDLYVLFMCCVVLCNLVIVFLFFVNLFRDKRCKLAASWLWCDYF